VYNPGGRLRRALDSVVAQTYADWECIVIDDGGDEPIDWVDGYHPQVRRVSQANSGVSIARNRALLHTDAPLVAYLDQDDEWLPEKLALQVIALGDGDVSWSSFVWVFESGEEQIAIAKPTSHHDALREGHFLLSSFLMRRETVIAVGGFNPLLRVNQDWDLILRFLAAGAVGVAVPDVLVRYHLHGANFSGDYATAFREGAQVYDLHRNAAMARRDGRLLGAAVAGQRRLRREHGMKAYDAFRASRDLRDIGRALRWNPRYVARGLRMSAQARLRRRG
jgi:glycosyltransferase involved in cell wall biosynthesis